MLKRLKDNKGFTIIEVMIVLAIAGLIILVVLLAVPALQRNARNTAIKNDASALAGGITEFESNNNGETPDTDSQSGSTVTWTSTKDANASSSTSKVQGSTVVNAVAAKVPASTPSAGTIDPVLGLTCSGTASTRAYSIYYSIESPGAPGGLTQECLDT